MAIELNPIAHTQAETNIHTQTHTLCQIQLWPVTSLNLSSEVTHLFFLILGGTHLSAPA